MKTWQSTRRTCSQTCSISQGVKTIAGGVRERIYFSKRWAETSPLHSAFFGRIDLGNVRHFTKQKSLDVVEQKRLRIGVREVQSVVVDDLCLLLQPAMPK